ncbi:MAG: SemiSWEET transporter [Flavobacteriaceae bacterium]|jgi:MtN3 and saliva related transmembrane protein|nr:SemiSWEET transporter [Flavobacteriaceae bacterium]MDG2289898.1 SemiSWEET transporter [Flavobacteriaceae bacterium]
MINPEYIGFFAATLTTSAFLPQAFKIWNSKKADGLSLTMYLVMAVGTLSWLAYGLLIESPSVIVANSISVSIIVFIITFIIRSKK